MRARHRTSKLLLRQGIVWSGGAAWTGGMSSGWASSFRPPGLQRPSTSTFETVLMATGAAGPVRQGDHRDGRRQQFAAGGPGCVPAGGLDADRVRARGRGRRLEPVQRLHDRGLPRARADRELQRRGPVARARSPRPATPTPAGCWSRPPGTTGGPTAPGKTMRARWDRPRPPREPAGMPATSACTSGGCASTSVRSGPSSRTSRSRVSWPAGAGRWRAARVTGLPSDPRPLGVGATG